MSKVCLCATPFFALHIALRIRRPWLVSATSPANVCLGRYTCQRSETRPFRETHCPAETSKVEYVDFVPPTVIPRGDVQRCCWVVASSRRRRLPQHQPA